MLGTARLLTFSLRALALLLIISIVWLSVASKYNEVLVSLAAPLLPDGVSTKALGDHIVFQGTGFASAVSINGLTLHFGLVLMTVLVLAAVGISPIARLGWLLTLVAGALLAHVAGVALLARGLVWAADAASPEGTQKLVFNLFAVFWGLLPAVVGGAWCLAYWRPRVMAGSTPPPHNRFDPRSSSSGSVGSCLPE